MALFKFVSSILEDKPIDIYNHGEMYRDFTYVEDLVYAIRKLVDIPPNNSYIKLKEKMEKSPKQPDGHTFLRTSLKKNSGGKLRKKMVRKTGPMKNCSKR